MYRLNPFQRTFPSTLPSLCVSDSLMPPQMSESHMGYNLKGAEWTAEEWGHAEIAPSPHFPRFLTRF